AGANCEPAGQKGGSAWRALGFDIEVGEARAFSGELVDTRCRCASHDAAAIDARLAITKIVGKDKKYVGLDILGPSRTRKGQRARQYDAYRANPNIVLHDPPP